jgi:ferredoxin
VWVRHPCRRGLPGGQRIDHNSIDYNSNARTDDNRTDDNREDEVRIVLDRTTCAGMGICEGLDAERFQIQADGKVQVLQDDVEGNEALEVAREAVETCPTESLRIVD